MSGRIETVIAADLCAGCGLCASVTGAGQAEMKLADAGWLRPSFARPLTETEDRLLADVCPGSAIDFSSPIAAAPVWGPIVSLSTGWSTDDDLRHRASSGGALSALLVHLLKSGQADYVLHVGADRSIAWLNEVGESLTSDGVLQRAGSRYAPSAPLADIMRRLDEDRRFVFVGKPCDVAALRALARHDRRVDQRVVAMLGFMCGGIPSDRGIRQLIRKIGAEPDEVTSFRYRGDGWPGQAVAVTGDGRRLGIGYAQSWGEVLSHHVQSRCKICPDGVGHFADVVFADAWDSDERGYPTFDEKPGVSMIIARSERGAAWVAEAERAGRLETRPLAVAALEEIQPYQARRTRLTPSRLLAMRIMGRPTPRYRGLQLGRAALRGGVIANLKSFLGTLRRIARGRMGGAR